MLRMMGAVLVIGGFSVLGLTVARGYGLRVQQLQNLQNAFQLLETEIMYGLTPLPEAFRRIAAGIPQPGAALFEQAAEGLDKRQTIQGAWQRAVAGLAEISVLSGEDLDIFRYFGYGLGEADTREQQKKFSLLKGQLERAVVQAMEERGRNQRVWQYLGVTTGIAVALLLI